MSRYREALGDNPFMWVRVRCDRCQHQGCYRLTNLVARYGLTITMFEVLTRLVEPHCWRWKFQPGMPGDVCGAQIFDIHYSQPEAERLVKKFH